MDQRGKHPPDLDNGHMQHVLGFGQQPQVVSMHQFVLQFAPGAGTDLKETMELSVSAPAAAFRDVRRGRKRCSVGFGW
jgi:hypothetical protein